MPVKRYLYLYFEELQVCVVVAAETGIVYQQQQRDMGGAGWPRVLPDDMMAKLRGAVEQIATEASGQSTEDFLDRRLQPLRLDEDQLAELDEAWVPVITADGPGVLVWNNSD